MTGYVTQSQIYDTILPFCWEFDGGNFERKSTANQLQNNGLELCGTQTIIPDPPLLTANDHHRLVTFLGRGSRLAFPFQPRDRHGCRTRLSRPTCAPRVTSSRVDNLFEPRREIRGGDPPRIPPTARSLPGCSRDPWIRHPAEGVRHPRQVGPDRPSARVTVSKPNANRVRVLPLARHRRHATLPRPQVRTAPTTPRGSLLPPASRRRFRPPNQILLEAC